MGSWLIATFGPMVLQAVLAALAKYALDLHEQNASRADQIGLGQSTVTAAVNKESADADHRASETAVNAPGVAGVLNDMAAGKF